MWCDDVAMTVQTWNMVISAAILGLLTGGGVWLKYVVEQQLKAKDVAIHALEAASRTRTSPPLKLTLHLQSSRPMPI